MLIDGYCLIKRNYLGGKARRKALKGLTEKIKNFNVLIIEVEHSNGFLKKFKRFLILRFNFRHRVDLEERF